MQSLLPAIYPIIKDAYGLDFGQIGLITLAFQLTASLLQPVVGMYTDRRPQPFSLVAGMGCTFVGLIVLAHAGSYPHAAARRRADRHRLVDLPPRVRRAWPAWPRAAATASPNRCSRSAGRRGSRSGPLLAAFIVVPRGQASISWFSLVALVAMVLLLQVGRWYKRQSPAPVKARKAGGAAGTQSPAANVTFALAILVVLMFSKNAYTASLSSYYTFYLIGKFSVSVQVSQMLLFLFLVAQALGSLIGGHLGDRFGRREIIWFSILGAVPFTLLLPFANLFWTAVLTDRHRHDHGERLSGHPGLRAGAAAGQSRHDRRAVLRRLVRPRRAERGADGRARRPSPASTPSTGCAPSCRCSACSPGSCRNRAQGLLARLRAKRPAAGAVRSSRGRPRL